MAEPQVFRTARPYVAAVHGIEAATTPGRDQAPDACAAGAPIRVDHLIATPLGRDRALDAMRGLAIIGVVLGHWLVTAVVVRGDGRLVGDSPLRHTPALAPLSWTFQTLAVFFLVGGHVAAVSHASAEARGVRYRTWSAHRLSRLFRPAAALIGLWFLTMIGLAACRVPYDTMRTMVTLVVSPLWFLVVFAFLTAMTPLVRRLAGSGLGLPLTALLVVAVVDVARFWFGVASDGLGLVNIVAGWLVPYGLGVAWAGGALRRRRTAGALLGFGGIATVVLVVWCGYPASMVGVPGAPISNLNPPTLAAVTFGIAQCGLALLLKDPLRRAMRRPALWAPVALLNVHAITVFLWHQTAMLIVMSAMLPVGVLPGLHTSPDQATWILLRLLWLPMFVAVLTAGLALAKRPTRPG